MKRNNATIEGLARRYQAARDAYLSEVASIADEIDTLSSNERKRFESLSEAVQESERGIELDERCHSLEGLVDELKFLLDLDEVSFDDLLTAPAT